MNFFTAIVSSKSNVAIVRVNKKSFTLKNKLNTNTMNPLD